MRVFGVRGQGILKNRVRGMEIQKCQGTGDPGFFMPGERNFVTGERGIELHPGNGYGIFSSFAMKFGRKRFRCRGTNSGFASVVWQNFQVDLFCVATFSSGPFFYQKVDLFLPKSGTLYKKLI